MTPAQLDHLSRIKRHLVTLLANAEKRTPGEWTLWPSDPTCVRLGSSGFLIHGPQESATFITSCAGNAEAGWRSTLVAIEWSVFMHENGQVGEGLMETILAAWPLELITKHQ